jgi:flagellar hook-associated protein FlgK
MKRAVEALTEIVAGLLANRPRREVDLRELKLKLAPKYAGIPSLPDLEDEEALKKLLEAIGRAETKAEGRLEKDRMESKAEDKHLATCLDCVVKHLSTARVAAREAMQRAEAGEPAGSIVEKVRQIYDELAGMELDIKNREIPEIAEIDDLSRTLRKKIFSNKWLTTPPTLSQLKNIEDELNTIIEKSYKAVEKYT